MPQPSFEEFLNAETFDASQASFLASSLRSGSMVLSPTPPGEMNEMSLLAYRHLRARDCPENFQAALPLLNALADLGQSPFHPALAGCASVYLEMLAEDDTHPIVNWCLDLPCAPKSIEPTRPSRLRSDSLEMILLETPAPGSARQISALDLFGFKLLEEWADGRTTIDRIMERYYQHQVVEGRAPRKDFEFAETQRGFTRLLNRALREDPITQHIHGIRWHAWHHACSAHERLHKGGLYREWGTELWQAALRQLDKTMVKALGLSTLPASEREDTLWQSGVSYMETRNASSQWAGVLGAAAWYQMVDSGERQRQQLVSGPDIYRGGRRPDAKPSAATNEWLRALDTGSAMVQILSRCPTERVLELFDEEVGLMHFSRALIDSLPSQSSPPSEILGHPALIPCLLPLLAKKAIWSEQQERFDKVVLDGAVWPEQSPWTEMVERHEWGPSMRAYLDDRELKATTPTTPRHSSRRF